MRKAKLGLAMSLILGACTFGQSADNFHAAYRPTGIDSSIRLSDSAVELDGELLAVQDTAILVLSDDEVTLIPYRAIDRATFHQLGNPQVEDGRRPASWIRERLRLVSRFPQGVDSDLLDRLLAAYGQSELRVMGR